jgi:sialic acid synthase SpsE
MIFIVKHRAHNSLTLLNNLLNIILIHTRFLFSVNTGGCSVEECYTKKATIVRATNGEYVLLQVKNSYGSAMQRLIRKTIKKPSSVLLKTLTQRRAIE